MHSGFALFLHVVMRNFTLILICLLAFIKVNAQLTGLDTSLNHIGSVVHNGADRNNAQYILLPNDFAVQPDGSVITVTSAAGRYSAFFVRFKENGIIDSSFNLWQQSLYVYGLDETSMRLHSLGDGRFMLFAKTSDDSVLLFRFLADGSPDGTLGGGGRKKYELKYTSFNNLPECLAVQPDGKTILCMNSAGIPRMLRIEANGKIDSSFGDYGYVTLNGIGGQGYKVNKILFTGSRILCAGANAYPNAEKYGVQAFKYNGEPDSSFGTNGITIVDIGWDAHIRGCGLQRDDKIILGGIVGGGYSNNVAVLRLRADGIVDSTFGTAGNGIEITDVNNSWDEVGGVNVDGNDAIWATTAKYNPNNASLPLFEPMLVRYTKNGKVDSLYKTNGRIPFTLTSDNISYMRTTIVKDKLLIFGNGYWSGNRCEYVARLFLRPVLNVDGNVSYCDYDTATIIGKSYLPHQWYRNDTLLSYTGDTLKTAIPGTYKLILTDGAASDSSQKVAVTFKSPVAKPVLTGITMRCVGDTLSLQAGPGAPGTTWTWMTPADTMENAGPAITVDSVTQADTGLYRVVALLDGCMSEEDSAHVVVYPVVIPSLTVTTDKINPGPWVDVKFSATAITNAGSTPVYQWTKNGANIPAANAAIYTATTGATLHQGDVICIKLTSSQVCARPATVSDCDTVNIDLAVPHAPAAGQLIIYPNPSAGRIKINSTSKGVGYLANIQGLVLMKVEINEGVNDIVIPASIADGIYILQLGQARAQLVIKR